MSAPGQAARAGAAALISGVLDGGRRLSELAETRLGALTGPERARAQSIAANVLRHLDRIDAALAPHLRKRPPAPALNALRIAAAEMALDGVPPHAAVDGAVRLTRADPKGRHLAGLVNAVARRAAESRGAWAEPGPARLPAWLDAPLRAAWGDAAAVAIAAAQTRPAPLDLALRDPADAERLAAALGAEILPTGGLRLHAPRQVTALPGFAEGAWWVQDAAAALPARLLAPAPGARTLDLCAAPGGKTLQLAAAGAEVTALDVSEARLGRLRENLARTGLTAQVVAADALAFTPPAPFAAILLDAPCSASGTLRRHPDLLHLDRGRDLAALGGLQRALLDRAWGWLAPGGRLVYATCSLLPAEGEEVVAAFCAARPEARRVPADPAALGVDPAWIDAAGALRTRPDYWPERGGLDGFYAALLVKEPNGGPGGQP